MYLLYTKIKNDLNVKSLKYDTLFQSKLIRNLLKHALLLYF